MFRAPAGLCAIYVEEMENQRGDQMARDMTPRPAFTAAPGGWECSAPHQWDADDAKDAVVNGTGANKVLALYAYEKELFRLRKLHGPERPFQPS